MRALLGIFLFLFFYEAYGQRYLVLDKPSLNKSNRIRYYIGDDINLRIKGEKKSSKITITSLTDTSIVTGTVDIPLNSIEKVTIARSGSLRNTGMIVLPPAGVIFFLADTFNPQNGEHPNVSSWGLKVGGGMIGLGLILRFTKNRSYKMNNYRGLKILQSW